MKLRPLHAEGARYETVEQLLEGIKARHRIPSWRKLAQFMEWSPSQLRHYRKGRSSPADAEAIEIARRLDVDDGFVTAICHAERAEDPDVKRMWLLMARQLSRIKGPTEPTRTEQPATTKRRATSRKAGLFALAAAGLGLFGHPAPAPAAESRVAIDGSIHYAQWWRRKRFTPARAFCTRRRRSRQRQLFAHTTIAP